ncbi:hypothetical protein BBJ41_32900 [Burkholderia stabilis]|uniref:ATP-binding protein n=1 Tax=Burkholderia stabilis TaxID=95485 RepID=UPI0008518011|nr:winged helix-turn-helix domain-containing protein [Burkholderia stabilis]AOR72444.1 hypothetical protein BBJ41_32900 [Burkholderia stabilis]HDR9489654.1 winged helix-turn-helix domain-containing protein [Burkholderia stabilis]HDR9536471.1 winged helix-turn-helix domain-containing protein [Burkholderia stabilis]HDR9551984.1 winged helix-turn-helix domain-containing protein [Burkholderia stabilis]HDR9562946.1 winged helix-turn-helix domain-containing protein [Burkholderia stabilis]
MPLHDVRTQRPSDEHFTLFGRFAIGRTSRCLWAEGKALALNERATDLLITLVDAGGRIVSIEQLQQHVWPGSSVSATSVQALVSQLRTVLGDDRDVIETVPRRGYRFAAEWCDIRDEWVGPDGRSDAVDPAKCALRDMLQAGRRDERAAGSLDDDVEHPPLIGRDAELSELLMLAPKHRLITLTSPAGNGKTRLAHEAALRTAPLFRDGVAYVDLVDLTLPELIADVIAAKIRPFSPHASSGSAGLVEQLTDRRMLLVIDHCDHLAQEVAALVETVLNATEVCLIVCAEAPLFIAEECVLPLAPLRFGGRSSFDAAPDVPDTPASDACRLLVAQLEASGVWPSAERIGTTSERTCTVPFDAILEPISRALSGNPLALELAARQIARAVRGRTTIASALEDWYARWRRLTLHRTGSHEVATGPAALVSSVVAMAYATLDTAAQHVLCCVSLIGGPFDLADACAVSIRPEETGTRDAEDRLQTIMSSLIDAGLVDAGPSADPGGPLEVPRPVRRFALEILTHRSDYADLSVRHAKWVVQKISPPPGRDGAPADPRRDHAPTLADLRRALGFSSSAGYPRIVVELLRHSGPVWIGARLASEWLAWIRRVLEHDPSRPALKVRDHMLLYLSVAQSVQHVASTADVIASWWRVYELATACADDGNRVLALSLLLMRSLEAGFNDDSPELLMQVRARILHECATSSSHRGFALLHGALLTFDGRHDEAISLFSPPDENAWPVGERQETNTPDYVAVVSDNALAMSLWLTGAHTISHPLLLRALQDARQSTDPIARCATAMLACVLCLLEGNTQRVAQQARLLLEIAQRNGLQGWTSVGRSFLQWTRAIDETHDEACALTRLALGNLARGHTTIVDLVVLERFCGLVLSKVDVSILIPQLEQMIANLPGGGRRWLMPEAWRVYAVIQHRAGLPAEKVHAALEQAAHEARQQRASLLWRRISATREHIVSSHKAEEGHDTTT